MTFIPIDQIDKLKAILAPYDTGVRTAGGRKRNISSTELIETTLFGGLANSSKRFVYLYDGEQSFYAISRPVSLNETELDHLIDQAAEIAVVLGKLREAGFPAT